MEHDDDTRPVWTTPEVEPVPHPLEPTEGPFMAPAEDKLNGGQS